MPDATDENELAVGRRLRRIEDGRRAHGGALTAHTWDGHFIFGNAKKLNALPKEVQASLTKNLNEAALKQREDIAKLNADAQAQLTKLGVTFNKPDPAPFRELLKSAGFYSEWKGKYGDEVWAKLEKYSGKLV